MRSKQLGIALVGGLAIIALLNPAVIRGEDTPGELTGMVEASTNADGSVALLTMDLLKSPSPKIPKTTNGFVDVCFIVVHPSERVTISAQMGTIILASPVRQTSNTSVEVSLQDPPRRLFIAAGSNKISKPAARSLRADLIMRAEPVVQQDHKTVAAPFFAFTDWDRAVALYAR